MTEIGWQFWLAVCLGALFFNLVQVFISYRYSRLYRGERRRTAQLEAQLALAQNPNTQIEQPVGGAQPPSHPIWAVIHIVFLVVGLGVALKITATDFDTSEGKTIVLYLLVAIAATQLGPRQFRLLVGV